jgi:HemK-related putative methylase
MRRARDSATGRLTGLARRSLLPLQRAWLRRRVGRLVVERVDGTSVIVLPEVFNPAVFRTSEPLLRAIDDHVQPGTRVLDLGTGSGIVGVRAALRGAHVIATDVNPEAVRCARMNALLNRVEDRIDVREGDLYEAVRGERFDLVVCNPPFFRGRPRHHRDAAWRGEDILERLARGLATVLDRTGYALIVFSSDGDEGGLLAALASSGFDTAADREQDVGNEVITVYRVTPRSALE